MFWLLYCGLFLVMLLGISRMLSRRGKWAWVLFLGLIASVAVYVGLFFVPVASATALRDRHALLAAILVLGTLVYAAALIYFVRYLGAKLQAQTASRTAIK